MNDTQDEKWVYIISIKSSSRLEELTRGSKYTRKTQEELQAMKQEKERMMKPILNYFGGLNLEEGRDYQFLINLATVTASLTPQQADDLKKESYVKDVVGDIPLELIE